MRATVSLSGTLIDTWRSLRKSKTRRLQHSRRDPKTRNKNTNGSEISPSRTPFPGPSGGPRDPPASVPGVDSGSIFDRLPPVYAPHERGPEPPAPELRAPGGPAAPSRTPRLQASRQPWCRRGDTTWEQRLVAQPVHLTHLLPRTNKRANFKIPD